MPLNTRSKVCLISSLLNVPSDWLIRAHSFTISLCSDIVLTFFSFSGHTTVKDLMICPLQTAKPKRATFQMRISPDVKQQAESLFATYGLTLTDTINVFIPQSLSTKGLPVLLSP